MPRRGTELSDVSAPKRSAMKITKGNPRKEGTTMKGKGPRIERETIIRLNEEEEIAHIGTASGPMYRKLKKLGFDPTEDGERWAIFEVPKKCVSVRKPIASSDKQLKALEKARAKAKVRSCIDPLKLQGQNGEKGASLGD